MAKLVDDGWRVELVTVFTKSVPNPTGFALACQTDKGLAADADYMAIRRNEDLAAARALGVEHVHHLDLPEAPHRGYTSAADLFAGMHDDDRSTTALVADAIASFLPADRVFLPLGLGNHVDHLHVIKAFASEAWQWLDTPYVLREPTMPDGERVDIATTLDRKLDACAAYTTQLPFQFGDEPAMRRQLTDLAEGGERFVVRH